MTTEDQSVFQIKATNQEGPDAAAKPFGNVKTWSESEESRRKWREFVLEATRCNCALPKEVVIQEYGLGS